MSPQRPPRPPGTQASAGTAVAGIERSRAVTMVVVRVGAMVLCGSLEVLGDGRWLALGPLPYLLGAMAGASLLVCAVTAARAALPPRPLLWADLALVVVVVLAAGRYAGPRVTDGWPGTILPYVLLVGIMVGISFRTFPAVLAWTAALGGALLLGYVQSDLVWWAALPHVAGLTTNATMAAYVMRVLFRTARDLDQARAGELRRSAQLSQERERGRTARVLHDRILQTMEALTRDGWIADPSVRARVAEESQWLRAFLRGDDGDPAEDVVAALEEVVRQAVGSGLRVEFNAGRLRSAPEREGMPAEVVEALSGILREALTNVRKHAGVGHAVVRAECRSGTLALSVLDHGSGFDPDAPTTGLGIARSIRDGARAVGGSADVEAAPGEGTLVSVRIPLPSGE
ncbi:sensor histidine kinase [Nonomuraea spiralis]|uniref:histidine kinase n=1 Tax=Nonomuraea spiralis TaxID=46182 RepID=A0ABV5IRQ0_9ACTN|nr:ATP-binding protein [Nonomuraea spiralis]